MKKNTLLYLDADLVERAKKENINISKLAEDALKEALKITVPRTAREYLLRVLADAGRELAFYGEVYLLPLQIESIKLENVGPFQEFEVKFRKDGINVIYGLCGSGKSTIIRSILLAFGKRHTYFSKLKNGKITLKLFPDQDSINITTNQENPLKAVKGYRCLIADDILQRMPKNMISEICEEMKKLGIQIIITASIIFDLSEFPKDTNTIPLESSIS